MVPCERRTCKFAKNAGNTTVPWECERSVSNRLLFNGSIIAFIDDLLVFIAGDVW